MSEYSFEIIPNTTPVLVEGLLFGLNASVNGRMVNPKLNPELHTFELAMVRLGDSGMVSVNVAWSRTDGFVQYLRVILPATVEGPKVLHREVVHMSGDEWRDRKNRARFGVDYMLSIDQPLTLGGDGFAELREAARMAEAKRRDVLNAIYALHKRHSS